MVNVVLVIHQRSQIFHSIITKYKICVKRVIILKTIIMKTEVQRTYNCVTVVHMMLKSSLDKPTFAQMQVCTTWSTIET